MQRQQASTGNRQTNNRQQATNTQPTTDKSGVWYFYNPTTVSQGKAAFERLWGKRENIDNWRRSNQTVVKFDNPEEANRKKRKKTATRQAKNKTRDKKTKRRKRPTTKAKTLTNANTILHRYHSPRNKSNSLTTC